MLEQGRFGFGEIGATPTTLRGPGFPLWLAGGMLLGGDSAAWLGFWSSLPGVVVAACLAAWLTRRYGVPAGLAGGLLAALHPLPAAISARTMADEFHSALGWSALAAASVALWAPSRRPGRWAAGAGLLMAGHLLTRSSGLLTLVALAIAVLAHRPRRPRLTVLVLALSLVPALAWSVRSSRLEHRPVFVQSLIGHSFWHGEGQYRYGPDRYPGEHSVKCIRLILEKAGLDPAGAGGFWWADVTPEESAHQERLLKRAAWQLVLDSPAHYARRVLTGLHWFWTRGTTEARTRQYRLLVFPVLMLGAWGALRLWRARGPSDELGRMCVVVVVLTNLAYAAIIALARDSVQVYSAMAYLVGVGAHDLARRAGAVRRSGPA
jgi:hypothetical protein